MPEDRSIGGAPNGGVVGRKSHRKKSSRSRRKRDTTKKLVEKKKKPPEKVSEIGSDTILKKRKDSIFLSRVSIMCYRSRPIYINE